MEENMWLITIGLLWLRLCLGNTCVWWDRVGISTSKLHHEVFSSKIRDQRIFSPRHPWTWLFCWHRPPEKRTFKPHNHYHPILSDVREWNWYKCLYVMSRLSQSLSLSSLARPNLTDVNNVVTYQNQGRRPKFTEKEKFSSIIKWSGSRRQGRGVVVHMLMLAWYLFGNRLELLEQK